MNSSTNSGAALTTKELAAYLKISIGTAYALMRSQDFPAVCIRPGKGRGTYRVMADDLTAWLAAQGKGGVA